MKLSLGFALGLLSPRAWAQPAQEELEVFSCMPPVRKALGVSSGKDLIVGSQGYGGDPPTSQRIRLMDHSFANSYGHPFVTEFPLSWPNGSEAVWFDVLIRAKGHQFDRLGSMWLGDTEIMRLSTPEPTDHGVVSYISKDLTQYLALFNDQNNKFIFDMGNIVNDIYTAPIHITVDAYFYNPIKEDDTSSGSATRSVTPPADQIIPVSAKRGFSEGKPSTWTFPSERAEMKFHLPKHVSRAVLTVAATGQADEEFWWSNVPESAADYYESTKLPGLSSFREVRVYIDDKEAGHVWPFPVVFTGGISPALHRPVAGIQAFDLREYEIDLTPWLGVLRDGKEHDIRMEVWGVDDSVPEKPVFKHAGHHWFLSGKIFVWWGDKETTPKASAPKLSHPRLDYKSSIKPVDDGSFQYTQSITREILTEMSEPEQRNKKKGNTFKSFQKYAMENTGSYRDYAQTQIVKSKYTGGSRSTHRGKQNLATWFDYGIDTTATYKTTPEVPLDLEATLRHTLALGVTDHSPLAEGAHAISSHWSGSPGTVVSNHKYGESKFQQKADGSSQGWGSTFQEYSISAMKHRGEDDDSPAGNTWYRRELQYMDTERILDKQYFMGKEATLVGTGTSPYTGPEPVERIPFPHAPTDYAPFPLVRPGIPNIYLRDRMAAESSSVVNVQKSSSDFSHMRVKQEPRQK